MFEENCNCFSCKENYTKAYINHLFFCHELNGPIILIMHNLYVLEQLINKYNIISNDIKDVSIYEYLENKIIDENIKVNI